MRYRKNIYLNFGAMAVTNLFKFLILIEYLMPQHLLVSMLQITSFDVPKYADPREAVHLVCAYELDPVVDKQDLPVTIELMKGNQTFYRHINNSEITAMVSEICPVEGLVVYLSWCEGQVCTASVSALPDRSDIYTCQVCTDFAKTVCDANIDVIAPPEKEPVVMSEPGYGIVGYPISFNCTSDYTWPATNFSWSADISQENEFFPFKNTTTKVKGGLISSTSTVTFLPNEEDLIANNYTLTVFCESSIYLEDYDPWITNGSLTIQYILASDPKAVEYIETHSAGSALSYSTALYSLVFLYLYFCAKLK